MSGRTSPWAAVMGAGAWLPGVPDVRALMDGTRRDDADGPPARLPVRLRRRASLLIRMVAEVAAQASDQAGISLGAMPIVVGSAYGELGTTMEMLQELSIDRSVSPFRFHNSVHNTASGYLSIAHENRSPATSLAAGWQTAAMALLEARTLLEDRGGDVLVVVADETLPAALTSTVATPVSGALILRALPRDESETAMGTSEIDRALAWLADLRQEPALDGAAAPAPVDRARPADPGVDPGRAFLRLVSAAAAAGARPGLPPVRIDLTGGGDRPWSVAVGAGSPRAASRRAPQDTPTRRAP